VGSIWIASWQYCKFSEQCRLRLRGPWRRLKLPSVESWIWPFWGFPGAPHSAGADFELISNVFGA
jgi:hypothetical protein